MRNNFKKPSIELTEELAQAIEKAAESYEKPSKEAMGLRRFMIRIWETLINLREKEGATWGEIADFLGEHIGHGYSENHIRVMYLSIESKKSEKKTSKKSIKKAPKEKTDLTPPKPEITNKSTFKPPLEPEQIINSSDPPKPKREYRPPPDMIVQGTKDSFN